MAVTNQCIGDFYASGAALVETISVRTKSITPAMQSKAAYRAQEKLVPGTAIVAYTADLAIIRGATGSLKAFEAAITGQIADDASRHAFADLHKSTGGGAFATVLSAPLDFTSASVIRTAVAATISSAGLVDGDILRLIVTVSGGSGNQGQGLAVNLTWEEDPN